jgi:hypothetical protein
MRFEKNARFGNDGRRTWVPAVATALANSYVLAVMSPAARGKQQAPQG